MSEAAPAPAAEATPAAAPAAASPAAPVFNPNLELVIEGWGGKQGFKYPTWKLRWFVLQKKAGVPPDSDDLKDARTYFQNSPDSYERAHNYNVKEDKKNLILTYFTDDSKTEVKEVFDFDENTCWWHGESRVTCPKFSQGKVNSIHLYCKGSRGAHKLIFIPFWGFVEPHFKLMCQPWILSMEFGFANCYDGGNGPDDKYYGDFITVDEDTYGRTSKDLEKKLQQFKDMFEDDVVFKDYKANMMMGAKLMIPIKFLGKNAQEDNKGQDEQDAAAAMEKQTEWSMKFNKKMKEQIAEKVVAGGRPQWLKLCAQAKHRNLKFDAWMQIKDQDNNIADLPKHLQ